MNPTKIRILLLAVVLLNVTLFCMNLNFTVDSDKRVLEVTQLPSNLDAPIYRFNNPGLANKVLKQLDIFEQVNVTEEELQNSTGAHYFGKFPDKDYCWKHRAFIVKNPEIIFTKKNIITSLILNSLMRRKVIPEIGQYSPNWRSKLQTGAEYFLESAGSFYTGSPMFYKRAIGQHFSCLSQASNGIPGNIYLYRKDYVSEGIVEYAKSYAQKTDCFNHNKFFPKTWILYHEEPCKQFFQHLNSTEYQQLKKERGEIVYMRKIGSGAHQGKGVFPIHNQEEENIRAMYENGALCGKNEDNNIIQYYIYNPLLLNGNKFDFRIYMLIASSNPVIAYYYDGFLRVSLHKYDSSSKELAALLTNTALSKSAFNTASQNGTYEGMTEDELKHAHLWNFRRLEDYLYDKRIIRDRNWLDNYLRPEFKKALVHLLRISQKHFMKKSSVYHLFGLDFMLDANLNLWFIEANASPALEGFSAEMENHVANMLKDHFEIVFGLIRSRMKRVIQFVNELTAQHKKKSSGPKNFKIDNLALRQEEFKKLTENRFEPEFQASPRNKFQPIINENFIGENRYFGLLKEECI